ncbi:MAG: hypothetical protein WA182_11230 [Candidatus Sulfotelmatobacter sp.]
MPLLASFAGAAAADCTVAGSFCATTAAVAEHPVAKFAQEEAPRLALGEAKRVRWHQATNCQLENVFA